MAPLPASRVPNGVRSTLTDRSTRGKLLFLDARGAHDLLVVRLLLAQELAELRGGIAPQQRPLLLELAADIGRRERLVELLAQPLDDRRRRLRRREEPGPSHHVEALHRR